MAILLRLLFAHILSDFVFQCDKICTDRYVRKFYNSDTYWLCSITDYKWVNVKK